MAKEIRAGEATVLVDDEDYDRLRRFSWYIDKGGYPARNVNVGSGRWAPRRMHQFVMMTSGLELIDHIDGDKNNCQKINLRPCSVAQNAWNAKKHKDNTSGYKGVGWSSHHKSWRARIMKNRKEINLGIFKDPVEAAKAYDRAAIEHHGEFARLNFPEGHQLAHTKYR